MTNRYIDYIFITESLKSGFDADYIQSHFQDWNVNQIKKTLERKGAI